MKTEYELIKTTHLDADSQCIYSEYDTPIEKTDINNLTDLYHFGVKEYGKCISKMHVDDKEGNAKHIGYVFHKKQHYEDSKGSYLMETWLSMEHYFETVEREYLPV